MESLKPRRLYNQARMLSGLVMNNSMSLSCLKVLDFTQLEEKSILFLRVVVEEILKVRAKWRWNAGRSSVYYIQRRHSIFLRDVVTHRSIRGLVKQMLNVQLACVSSADNRADEKGKCGFYVI
uniref:Uncharacterized protein n=1 Tax=Hyaloperonospora arabidopsidis (strain Emoy2) TaxID=559515 RepID=M4BM56_HYAAE